VPVTRERQSAERRLRQLEWAARARFALDAQLFDRAILDRSLIPDSERFAAPLLERIGVRGRVQLVLWASMTIVFAVALVSFFSAPLMDLDVAISAALVGTLLILAHVM
jgi:hypothetical protein